MYNVKPKRALSKPEFHEATYIWRFNKGTNGFYKVKPPELNIEAIKIADG